MYSLDPWGPERIDYMLGQVCAMVANVNRSKGAKVFTWKDFAPRFREDTPEEKALALKQQMDERVRALNERNRRQEKKANGYDDGTRGVD